MEGKDLHLDFSLLGNKGFLCLAEENGSAQGIPNSPPIGTMLIKPFFFPHQLLCYVCVWQQAAKSHFLQ